MSSPAATSTSEYVAVLAALRELSTDVGLLHELPEADLLEINSLHAQAARLLGAAGAAIAGELAFRSRPELGGGGLARRSGYRTVENLVKATTGATKDQVVTVVAAGVLLVEAANSGVVDQVTGEVFTPVKPWLRPVAEAVAAGRVSVSASRAIETGLGVPNSAIASEHLLGAAVTLVGQAVTGVDADRLCRNAHNLREELDLAGVRVREEEHRALRGLTHFPLSSGGGKAIWTMDPETYATFTDVYDRLTSPKRGGIRFIDPDTSATAERIRDDDRTPTQLASDGFLHLLHAGADVDDTVMIGSGAPVIRITVAQPALEAGVGLARIDGQATPISLDTVQRLLCEGETIRMVVDGFGHPVESETEQRLFSRRQREVLAAKFGGCMDPNCDRPPSWCEAHHIHQWKRDHGKTHLSNGILLCKYHHLKYHNDGIEILIDDTGQYWKIPAPTNHPASPGQPPTCQAPILMEPKTRNLNDLRNATARAQTQSADARQTAAALVS